MIDFCFWYWHLKTWRQHQANSCLQGKIGSSQNNPPERDALWLNRHRASSAGGPTDALVRTLSERTQASLGQPLIEVLAQLAEPLALPWCPASVGFLNIFFDAASNLTTGRSICQSSTSCLSTRRLADLMAASSSTQSI
jgi:hypothetical protein